MKHHKFILDIKFTDSFTERKQDSLISLFYLNKPSNIHLSVKVKVSPATPKFDPLGITSVEDVDVDLDADNLNNSA